MKVSICIGSACHLKGSRDVIRILQELVASHGLEGKVNLTGAFCSGNCRKGVCVTIDDQPEIYSVKPETAQAFFEEQVLTRV
ncbi:MAG: (2Fe-2S) ferredoxin domain-containing protein [Bacillota bacterium]|uniref:Thioredoxin-like [2Fe-2S] ferredoxin n=1 Tax=[Clostridium] aminophilum TaxID=1526 RepID=A0A1I6KKW2_9FIRM|nr:(2Fe-2S) ferredoxin domain-containing protein [[Clostridium] aminophilum]MCR4628520.1 (2Fe-2S) ferredoxin domain-containing protein [Clostridium sp.]MDT3843052.1 (2Fe-2S) ferredoxin domain-containing protein [Bacillota bacterium]MDD6196936.1 (2Fe-2S) ferredoxin domain-containing protein [[Clostridium] aminophilum]SET29033.1 Thioredoxin-like [2Fe-2S] ferredoxin [[Clostridium] aminophilum]SFR91678.1 Thioredoxin-like [2Fe-2S] ferredoxin [[Clostridium] aminophilum]